MSRQCSAIHEHLRQTQVSGRAAHDHPARSRWIRADSRSPRQQQMRGRSKRSSLTRSPTPNAPTPPIRSAVHPLKPNDMSIYGFKGDLGLTDIGMNAKRLRHPKLNGDFVVVEIVSDKDLRRVRHTGCPDRCSQVFLPCLSTITMAFHQVTPLLFSNWNAVWLEFRCATLLVDPACD